MKLENPSRYILAVLVAEGQIEADRRFGILTWVFNGLSRDAAFRLTVKNILICFIIRPYIQILEFVYLKVLFF